MTAADDRAAITAIVHRYCELFDSGDFDAFAAQFEHGRWFRAGEGTEAVRSWIDANVVTHDGSPRTKHVTTNLTVDVAEDGTTATASSYVTVFQALPDFPLQPIFSGRYYDRFEKVDGKWSWRERAVEPDLYGDTSHHTRTGRQAPGLPAAIQALADRQEVYDLCVRYARALDHHDWEKLANCFVPEAIYRYPGDGLLEGVDQIVDRCRRALSPLTASQHLIGSVVVDLEGETGKASCYFQAQHVLSGTEGGDTYTIAGTYDDRVVRTAGGWRIVERVQSYTWTGGNRAVVHP